MNYYDNNEILADLNGNVYVDRVYCLDFNLFDSKCWSNLSQVYRLLPNQIIIDNIEQAIWFGEESSCEHYLYASVEPSGLQVTGFLNNSDWNMWEQIFNAHLTEFPLFEM
jgi:hypothetical protein